MQTASQTAEAAFTEDELASGEQWPTLGPAHEGARKAAQKVMEGFEAEHFKPLIDKFARDFSDRLWNDLEASLLSDVESNLHGSLWRMVDATVNALLTGKKWALERYVVDDKRYGEAPRVRAAIVEHCREQLADQRIADLEKEIANLKLSLDWARRS